MKIKVVNFKGIDEFELDTSKPDIFVLAGENSGGKTSLIQSLLMIAQSVLEGKEITPIVFDGKFLKLGGIESVIKQNLLKSERYIKYTFSDSLNSVIMINNKNLLRKNNLLFSSITSYKGASKQAQLRNQFSEELSKGSFQLELKIVNKDGQGCLEKIVYKLILPQTRECPWIEFNYLRKLPDGSIKYNMITNNYIFLKNNRSKTNHEYKSVYSLIDDSFTMARCDFARIQFDEIKPIIQWREDEGIFISSDEKKSDNIIDNSIISFFYNDDNQFNNRLDTTFIDYIHGGLNSFYKNLLYIGPLREYPESLYIKKDDIIKEIGIHGENAGAILAISHNKIINYPILKGNEVIIVKGQLIEAVKYWLCDTFSLAKEIKVNTYKNNNIYEIEITNNSGTRTSINNVGFGISQILPIIVLGLISEKNQTLIFEQPEIHLHPKVQSILFDFFRAIAFVNRKIIIETHSDHFVTRLRRRVAEDKTNILSKKILLLFAESNKLFEMKIDEYGYFDTWPVGFFDQEESELSLLLKARASKKSNVN